MSSDTAAEKTKHSIDTKEEQVAGIQEILLLAEEEYDEENDTEDEDQDEESSVYIFTLFDLDESKGLDSPHPIFTRDMLHRIAEQKDLILSKLDKDPSQRLTDSVSHRASNGIVYNIWTASSNEHHDDITVNYMTRVEQHPDFQRQFGDSSDRIKELRSYNQDKTDQEKAYIPIPYFFTTYERSTCTTHQNPNFPQAWMQRLCKTKKLWLKSSSKAKLCSIIRDGATKIPTITKIVCLGLGRLNCNPGFYSSALQHMTVFTIADALNTHYRLQHPNQPPVQIILQDPCYFEKDRILIKKLYHSPDCINFVSDPEGLLAISANTLVITAFLPNTVPLMQILADLFSSTPGQGPAMLLGDAMQLNPVKREYCLHNRDAPHVVRWIGSNYQKYVPGFADHVLEPELREDSYGDEGVYWLRRMDMYVRKS